VVFAARPNFLNLRTNFYSTSVCCRTWSATCLALPLCCTIYTLHDRGLSSVSHLTNRSLL